MPIDKIDNDINVYSDIQGLEQLHTQLKTDPVAAKKQVAQQFEALLVQMMMKSMRDANKTFSSDLLGSNDMDFYQEMFDKQLSLSLSTHGLGIAKMIEDNIDAQQGVVTAPSAQKIALKQTDRPSITPATIAEPKAAVADLSPYRESEALPAQADFSSPKSFVQAMWGSAKRAAETIGVSPSVLIAQAALETDWGKKMLNHNLFNIKADSGWKHASTTVASLENKNGVLVKEKASYRAYPSIEDSVSDYAHFVKSNQRYSAALSKADNPAAYMNALQAAGYATDDQYAKKVMQIHESTHFKNLLIGLK